MPVPLPKADDESSPPLTNALVTGVSRVYQRDCSWSCRVFFHSSPYNHLELLIENNIQISVRFARGIIFFCIRRSSPYLNLGLLLPVEEVQKDEKNVVCYFHRYTTLRMKIRKEQGCKKGHLLYLFCTSFIFFSFKRNTLLIDQAFICPQICLWLV